MLHPRERSSILLLSAASILCPWVCLAIKAPALYWSSQPLPFARIRETSWHVGVVSDTMLLLALLAIGYALLAVIVESSQDDLPPVPVIVVSALSGLTALLTYALLAEDVNYLLGNLWTFSFAGENPYETSIAEIPNHPFRAFTTWTGLEYLYGPAVLLPGSILIRLTGFSVLNAVLAMKAVMLVVFWLSGTVVYLIARRLGARKPVGLTALLLWNPLVLAESVMTPHLDLAMAALLLLAALAWMTRREAATLGFFALSIGVKLVTALLLPIALLGVAVSLRRRRWQGARAATLVLGALGVIASALWPDVWQPLLENGISKELGFDTIGALLPPVVTWIQALAPGWVAPSDDPWEVAQTWRWALFTPFWVASVVACGWIASRMSGRLPQALLLPLAAVLLGYHILFTMVVLPWHFITAICLTLASGTRAGRLAAVAITLSGLAYHLNDRWVWLVLEGQHQVITLVMMTSLLSGPAVALCLVLAQIWRQARAANGEGLRQSVVIPATPGHVAEWVRGQELTALASAAQGR